MCGLMSPAALMLCPLAWLDSIRAMPARICHRMPRHFGTTSRTATTAFLYAASIRSGIPGADPPMSSPWSSLIVVAAEIIELIGATQLTAHTSSSTPRQPAFLQLLTPDHRPTRARCPIRCAGRA